MLQLFEFRIELNSTAWRRLSQVKLTVSIIKHIVDQLLCLKLNLRWDIHYVVAKC